MAGIRIYDIIEIDKSKEDACKAVKQYASNSCPSPDPSYTPLYRDGSGSGSGGAGGGSGGGETAGVGGTMTTSSITGGSGAVNQCTGSPSQCLSQLQSSSAAKTNDMGLLGQLGAGNIPPIPNANELIQHAAKAGAGAALGGILPSSMGSAGAALAGVAQAAQEDGAKLSAGLGMSPPSSTYSGSGAGSAKGGGSGDNTNLASLFGGGPGGGGMGGTHGPTLASFGVTNKPVDIWHTGTRSTLFEIVSDKIIRISNRIQ
jgi:hypothetical protein